MRADPHKGRFRSYLKQAIRNFLVDEHRRERRSVTPEVRPDALQEGWDSIATASSPGPDAALLRAWARSLVHGGTARDAFEDEVPSPHFDCSFTVCAGSRSSARRASRKAFDLDEKTAPAGGNRRPTFRALCELLPRLSFREDIESELQRASCYEI